MWAYNPSRLDRHAERHVRISWAWNSVSTSGGAYTKPWASGCIFTPFYGFNIQDSKWVWGI